MHGLHDPRRSGPLGLGKRRAAFPASLREWHGTAVSYALGALLFCTYAVSRGQDANWDLQNYHDYVAYALLHFRLGTDVAPGGVQTYLNPLPYLLPYLARHHLPPVLAACVLAAAQAAAFPLLWAVSGHLTNKTDAGLCLRGIMVLVAGTSAITLSEVGTSFSDLQLAALGLAALLSMLAAGQRASAGGPPRIVIRLQLLAGVLSGAAAGLKLTNALVVLALLGAAAVSGQRWNQLGRAFAAVLVGAAFGGLVSGGWWAATLLVQFDSPTFPYFNSVFRASSATFENFSDPTYVPKGLSVALGYPLQIALGLHPSAENPFRDARLLVALAMCLTLAIPGARRAAAARLHPAPRLAILQTSAFLVAGLAAWLFAFGIQRYAIVFEMAAGLLIPAIAGVLLPARVALAGTALASAALMAWTVPADWWHRPWTDTYSAELPEAVSARAAAFLWLKMPFGYWGRALPGGSKAYMMQDDLLQAGGVLQRRFDAGMRLAPNGLIWNLAYDAPLEIPRRQAMAAHGLAMAAPCYRAPSLWWIATVFCRVEHAEPRALAASDLAAGQDVSFSTSGSGYVYELSGWTAAGESGVWSSGAASSLVLRPQASSEPLALDLDVAGLVGPSWPSSEVEVSTLAGVASTRWLFKLDEPAAVPRTVCVPPAGLLQGGVLELSFRTLSPHTPEQAGIGKDQRVLGIWLRSMRLRLSNPGECAT